MAVKFGLRRLVSDPTVDAFDPLTLAGASTGAGAFSGIDRPTRVHLVGSYTLDSVRQTAYVPLALAAGQTVALDVDFTPGNLRLYVLDSSGIVVGQNDDAGLIDDGSPGTFDPHLVFGPPRGGIFYIVVTSFDNAYLGNWQFENDGTVTGGFQLDISTGPSPAPIFLGAASDDFLDGFDTPYRINGQGGADRIWLFGNANDTITGGDDSDDLRGGPGHDVIVGGTGDDIVEGGTGNDILVGGDGVDILDGGNGNDRIFSGAGDLVNGRAGNDTITGGGDIDGGEGDDVLTGDRNGNTIWGGVGHDEIFGNAGNDTLLGGAGGDAINGGTGLDFVVFDPDGEAVVVNLTAGTASGQGADTLFEIEGIFGTARGDTLSGNSGGNVIFGLGGKDYIGGDAGNDQLFGDDGDDVVAGGIGNDSIEGNAGDDTLSGLDGKDVLDGGDGDDRLFGGRGRDVLTGGADNDEFIFRSKAEVGLPGKGDLVADFSTEENDKIDFRAIDADEFEELDQAFVFIGDAAFSGAVGQLRFVLMGAGLRLEGDTNGDFLADFELTLSGTSTIAASDIRR